MSRKKALQILIATEDYCLLRLHAARVRQPMTEVYRQLLEPLLQELRTAKANGELLDIPETEDE